ncbi:hypothetical protein CCR94_08095 [Rhodoblastus sphagnicola]|uniref:RNA polymerase subunit sigma-70 n=1 Tax=Rhodoblastus sphagnicola TaxID=333368 RepID=A0A2S6NAU5_9HYPH|nr:sigma-70 family RNA polymerase sigma factor [Rhodoblastus sphagnicola]MBB4198976.1 RNA polymerase sigma-70 factor (ECF subfamily) [Rhodoblastus sphagnicola]PPQ31738.1 hypothetical protein CCR94_08095 [Rhodoblastus sphagnicola]
MTSADPDALRRLFLLSYGDLKSRLTQRLGSAELASDAMQDTWLRLAKLTPVNPVQRPWPYILRIAYNIALKRLRSEQKLVTLDDARAALDLVDEAPAAARIAEGRAELALLRQAVDELTPRRREILLASRLDGASLRELANRFNISQRLVERELKQAVLHCAERLERKIVQRFGPRAGVASTIEKKT